MQLSEMPAPADVLLSDGSLAVVRSARPDDAAALHDLHEGISDDALWLRFFSTSRRAAHLYVDKVVATGDTIALVAEVDGRVAAVATAEPVGEERFEVSFLVADELRGKGVGTLLLEHVVAIVRSRGCGVLEARVLQSNHRMLEVFKDAGFDVAVAWDGGEELIRLTTALTPEAQAAADDREFRAEQQSLAPLLEPRGVAIYGARRDGTGIGGAVVAAVRAGHFAGAVVVVHPTAPSVAGLPAYRSASTAGETLDLAIIAVPAEAVLGALEDAATAGVRAAVVISSGFREMGHQGATLQAELVRSARTHGIRLVGPNGLGLVCNDPEVRLNATFAGTVPSAGGLAVASQSGGVGIALMDLVERAGIGLRSFVSLGNKADVSGNDLLAAWYDDEQVTCAALYLESFGNARKFARFARRFSERKPLVAVVGGRSSGGRRAGSSHTAAAASPAAGVKALFAQAGVIACRDAEELADTALLLTHEPLPSGRRVAVISNAGGLGVLAADLAADQQLDVVELGQSLQLRLADGVSQTVGTTNPVDAGAGAGPAELARLAATVLESGEVDSLVAVLVATGSNDLADALDALAGVRVAHPGLPVLAVPLGAVLRHHDIATFGSSAAALGALGRAVRYAEWRRTAVQDPAPSDPAAVMAARRTARSLLSGPAAADGWVTLAGARSLLEAYRIEPEGRCARGAEESAALAEELGFPVAVKVAEADVVHKTDRGLVRVGLRSRDEVTAAVGDFERVCGRRCLVLVQPMATGVELALGVVRDPSFGPMVMIAAGGIATDALDDRAFLLPPFSESEALRVLRSLRISPLLDGFRGMAPVAIGEVARLAAQLGRLAVDVPEVAEVDLNPVMAGPAGCAVVDVKLRLATAPALSADLPSQLRRPS
jgi:acyl-CoA synthetase (NDP forming)/GNAT superfamily N-acetyltransferase